MKQYKGLRFRNKSILIEDVLKTHKQHVPKTLNFLDSSKQKISKLFQVNEIKFFSENELNTVYLETNY